MTNGGRWRVLVASYMLFGEIENRTPDAGFEPSRRALLPVAGERRSDQWREVACFGRLLYVVWGDRK